MPTNPEVSYFALLAPALGHYSEVIALLSGSLRVNRVCPVTITPDNVAIVEPEAEHCPKIKALILRSLGNQAFVGEVIGDDAATTLRKISGCEHRPAGCSAGTIRRRFGAQEAAHDGQLLYWAPGITYAQNSVHAAQLAALLPKN